MSLKFVGDMHKEFWSGINTCGTREKLRGRKWGLGKSRRYEQIQVVKGWNPQQGILNITMGPRVY